MVKINNLRILKEQRQELRNNMTVPEKILWKWIRGRQVGYKFRRQTSVGKYFPDFYCPRLSLVVEIDGQIHGEETVVAKDMQRDTYMNSIGIHVKRYTAKEINDNLEWVLQDLKETCDRLASAHQKKANPTSPPLSEGREPTVAA